jgi:hypothetical protein
MVALALADRTTAGFTQKPLQFRREDSHAARVLTTPVLWATATTLNEISVSG